MAVKKTVKSAAETLRTVFKAFYNRVHWKNRPDMSTPLGQMNLNNMDGAIETLDQRMVILSENKADVSEINSLVKSWAVDTDTWIVTITHYDGSVETVDFPIESTVVNFDINDDNQLVLTREDGTTATIDLTRFVYSVSSTATVSMTITDRVIKAEIVKGSVTMEHLEKGLHDTLEQYKLDAQSAASESLTYSQDSKCWAVGGQPAFAENNSKYYCLEAQNAAQLAQEAAGMVYPELTIDTATGQLTATTSSLILTIDEAGHLHSERSVA